MKMCFEDYTYCERQFFCTKVVADSAAKLWAIEEPHSYLKQLHGDARSVEGVLSVAAGPFGHVYAATTKKTIVAYKFSNDDMVTLEPSTPTAPI
mmetsp:Transcript_35883/g.26657  ORF Transcript_35883/g.26657 Transcript_35883/m.26657 type:complete len:94 (-) Transcript_35883:372-653(-)